MSTAVDNEQERTLWCGNLHEKVTEEILYELFLQAGPLEKVKIVNPKENKPIYAFITFKHEISVPFTKDLMGGIQLFGKPLKLQSRTRNGGVSSSQTSTPCPSPLIPSNHGIYDNGGLLTFPQQQPNMGTQQQQPAMVARMERQNLVSLTSQDHPNFHRSISQPDFVGSGGNSGLYGQWNAPGKFPHGSHHIGVPLRGSGNGSYRSGQPRTPDINNVMQQIQLMNQANHFQSQTPFTSPWGQLQSSQSVGGSSGRNNPDTNRSGYHHRQMTHRR